MRDDIIIRIAREAGLGNVLGIIEGGALRRFAALVLANNPPQSSMAWQEGFEAGKQLERQRLHAFMRQMFDAYTLSSDPGKLREKGQNK